MKHHEIHETCLKLCQGYIRMEAPIVAQLQRVGETKLYKELGIKSLFTYAVKLCGLPEGAAYSFIAVGCGIDRWIDYHHIVSVAKGGSNHPDNITTLCSFHHDLVHQMVLPIDGGMSWIRSRSRAYRAFSQ